LLAPPTAKPEPISLAQDSDQIAPRGIAPSELASLGDPLFKLLLGQHADETRFDEIASLIQPDVGKRELFVVSESIVAHQQPASRRAVMAFTGTNRGENLNGNVMLSFSFGSADLPQNIGFLEAWGWDNHRSRYNFYRLDKAGTPGQPTWKFRGSSELADLLSPQQRQGKCVRCHINGAPIMKELLLPWNNWHSLSSRANYLVDGSGDPNLWPVARQDRFKRVLNQAERLEDMIIPAIHRFNRHRINRSLERRDDNGDTLSRDGLQTVVEGRRLLRPLFETTEFNIASARENSGFHPLAASGSTPDTDAITDVRVPETLFLNANLIAGGGRGGYLGLGILTARRFRETAVMKRTEYKALVQRFDVQMARQTGDANFAWLIPEPSHIDVDLIDQLLRRGIITPHFLASVLAVDLRDPLYFSSERQGLLEFVPEVFQFQPIVEGATPLENLGHLDNDFLTKEVIARLEAATPESGSRAARWLARLKADDAVASLKTDVEAYLSEVEASLRSDVEHPERRTATLEALFRKALDARRAILQHTVLGELDETGGRLLFPLPLDN
jgi:hypothetical protein